MSEGILIRELLEQAARAAYVLQKIDDGDHKALENAGDCADRLKDIVHRLGYAEPWFKEWVEEA
jgi:uncharacterized Ntn-hydrolase superfamily protein